MDFSRWNLDGLFCVDFVTCFCLLLVVVLYCVCLCVVSVFPGRTCVDILKSLKREYREPKCSN